MNHGVHAIYCRSFHVLLLADRTMTGFWHDTVVYLSVRLSVCDEVYYQYAAQGRCIGD